MKVPEEMTFEDASTLGAGIITMGQSLYQSLGLPQPDDPAKEPIPLLIYGGSTATGTLAIQFAKMYVHRRLSACSHSC
jgi:NADPH:quinone reductase-like Zn-dependent oxidoreductase